MGKDDGSIESYRLLVPKFEENTSAFCFPFLFHAHDGLEGANTIIVHSVMICFTDRASLLLTMVDCSMTQPNKEKRHFIDYETKVPKLGFVPLNFIDDKIETLHLLTLNY